MKQELLIKAQCYNENVLKAKVLETTVEVYKQLQIQEMKVVNIGGGVGAGN